MNQNVKFNLNFRLLNLIKIDFYNNILDKIVYLSKRNRNCSNRPMRDRKK